MFNIGPGELMAILAVALIVLGPSRLPDAVRTVGRVVGELRRISSGFQEELRNAFDDNDVIDQLEKGPSAKPAGSTDAESETSTKTTSDAIDTPIVDMTGTLGLDADASAGLDDAADNDLADDDFVDDTDADGIDTAALGLSSAASTEPAGGSEESEETDEDPPETDQRAAS